MIYKRKEVKSYENDKINCWVFISYFVYFEIGSNNYISLFEFNFFKSVPLTTVDFA